MLNKLEEKLKELGKVAVAYSGGIDSSFLTFYANKILGNNLLAIIVDGCMMSRNDYEDAIKFLKDNNINYKEIKFNPLKIKEFKHNNKDRCYYCKKELMKLIIETANTNGFYNILDGKNIDDLKVYRPGNKAAEQLGIISPLAQLNFNKKKIREYSKKLGISFWNKPSNSCLVTRYPYNTNITLKKLKKVEESEEVIKKLGINNVRVRVHNDVARIEVNKDDFIIILSNTKVIELIKDIGFKYVTLDLNGIRSGSFDI